MRTCVSVLAAHQRKAQTPSVGLRIGLRATLQTKYGDPVYPLARSLEYPVASGSEWLGVQRVCSSTTWFSTSRATAGTRTHRYGHRRLVTPVPKDACTFFRSPPPHGGGDLLLFGYLVCISRIEIVMIECSAHRQRARTSAQVLHLCIPA
jgi:hypothetical protein